jgi:hypothetical protein
MHNNKQIWQALGPKLRELSPLDAEMSVDLQALVLRLVVTDTKRAKPAGASRVPAI